MWNQFPVSTGNLQLLSSIFQHYFPRAGNIEIDLRWKLCFDIIIIKMSWTTWMLVYVDEVKIKRLFFPRHNLSTAREILMLLYPSVTRKPEKWACHSILVRRECWQPFRTLVSVFKANQLVCLDIWICVMHVCLCIHKNHSVPACYHPSPKVERWRSVI